jgi:hypothetical protein
MAALQLKDGVDMTDRRPRTKKPDDGQDGKVVGTRVR